MRVIKTSNKQRDSDYPRKIVCPECESELEIDREDIHIGHLGMALINCPICGEEIEIEDESIKVTKDNIKFPDHFYDFRNGVKLSNEEIEEYIRKGIEYFRKNPTSFSWSTGTGDTHILVLNYSGDEDYSVVVSKGYYETEIDYEKEDYDAQDSSGWDWKNEGFSQKIINNNNINISTEY